MEISRKWRFSWCLLLGLFLLATTLQSVQGEEESEAPSQCRPFIEKALKEQQGVEATNEPPDEDDATDEAPADDSEHDASAGEDDSETGDTANAESTETQQDETAEVSAETEQPADEASVEKEEEVSIEIQDAIEAESVEAEEMQGDQASVETAEEGVESVEAPEETEGEESKGDESVEAKEGVEEEAKSEEGDAAESSEELPKTGNEPSEEDEREAGEEFHDTEPAEEQPKEADEQAESTETAEEPAESVEEQADPASEQADSIEDADKQSAEADDETAETTESGEKTAEPAEAAESTETVEDTAEETDKDKKSTETAESVETEGDAKSAEEIEEPTEVKEEAAEVEAADVEPSEEGGETKEEQSKEDGGEASVEAEAAESETKEETSDTKEGEEAEASETEEDETKEGEESKEAVPEEDLIQEIDIPEDLRPREHIDQLLKLDDSSSQGETIVDKINEITLKELKKVYENAIKPLETLYKYRDLSNRHFGDSEIFSKPLVVFMGPWSGGKSSIINYLTDNEYNLTSLRTGAEPSPAYFNLLMYGEEPEVLDGTQLAADFTFAGLQKFGQGLEERLRGLKLPNKLLEKINIVEIPGILEVRKQVSRVFPFNDACQWFIDRADIIFLVYDPSKLDVGPETEAILDQLKGREHQTRIVLNKADQVKPEELMRVQGALIWNISPLMSSAQPPVMYTTSLWSRPYETWAPVRLLQAQERAFLRDLRSSVDKRIENKISSARRFAVRVRNHAKMVDCYLTTYYNHKSVFGNRKQVSDQIIDHPQDYHIYEGLSTLTNISRYDLPDPDVYKDFFRLNPLYDFQQLSATCTYFRGCPINRLDVAIAYDLPELVGKHKKLVESALAGIKANNS